MRSIGLSIRHRDHDVDGNTTRKVCENKWVRRIARGKDKRTMEEQNGEVGVKESFRRMLARIRLDWTREKT